MLNHFLILLNLTISCVKEFHNRHSIANYLLLINSKIAHMRPFLFAKVLA